MCMFIYRNYMRYILLLAVVLFSVNLYANVDSLQNIRTTQDAVYRRPFIGNLGNSTSIGGYAEANTNYFSQSGVSEGFSMEMRRFNLFVYSSISSRIKLLAELEFEHGTEEIALETAMLDFEIDPAIVFRGGIILAPIGGFNQKHDSPLYEFIDRPMVSTQIIPATLSEMGFGVNGKMFFGESFIATYDAYIVNGLRDGIILNSDGRTLLRRGRVMEMFEESHNGVPSVTGKIALRHRQYGEIGISAYRGIYNSFRKEGIDVDERRAVLITALDYSLAISSITIQGEVAMNTIDVPANLKEINGSKQLGFYTDVIFPVTTFTMLDYANTVLNLNARIDYIDYNIGTFAATGGNIGDEVTALSFGVSLRPTTTSVFRVNYRNSNIVDIVGNSVVNKGIQFGFATYF